MNSLTNMRCQKNRIIGCFLLFILLVFVLMTVTRNQINSMTVSGSDGMTYFNAARNLRKYHLLTHDRDGSIFEGVVDAVPTDTIAPGYPVFLYMLFWIFPETLDTVFASNLVLGIITILLVWKTLQGIHVSPWLSLIITFLYANFPTTVDMTTTCLTENLFCPLLLGSNYLCIRASQKKNDLLLVSGAFLLLALASTVRGQAFMFLPLQLILLLSDRNRRKNNAWRLLGLAFISMLAVYVPMWSWLAVQLGRFVLYPTAGDGPRIWGAMPYFIDMSWTKDLSLAQIQEYNSTVAPEEYIRWRSFGMLWRMWFDCWSEDLPHGWYLTHWSLYLHPLIVLPTLILCPIFGRQYKREELFLATIPTVLTISCLFYHGLPRYVSAAYPILFVLAGANVQILQKNIRIRTEHRERRKTIDKRTSKSCGWKRNIIMGIWGILSIMLVYSICFFPWRVDEEQSSYRLRKYEGINFEQVREGEEICSLSLNGDEVPVWNAIPKGNGRYWISWTDHAIIQLDNLEKASDDEQRQIVTKVTLDVDGGNIYDFATVYWIKDGMQGWSEDYVFSIPRSNLPLMEADQPVVWIDGDVNALLIVPALFRGNEICINRITIEKFAVQ